MSFALQKGCVPENLPYRQPRVGHWAACSDEMETVLDLRSVGLGSQSFIFTSSFNNRPPRSTFLENCHSQYCAIVYGFASLTSTQLCSCLCLYLLAWLDKPTHSRAWAASQGSQALPCIVSDFLFGKSPCDFHALEDLDPCEISPGELATLKSMLCLLPVLAGACTRSFPCPRAPGAGGMVQLKFIW